MLKLYYYSTDVFFLKIQKSMRKFFSEHYNVCLCYYLLYVLTRNINTYLQNIKLQ